MIPAKDLKDLWKVFEFWYFNSMCSPGNWPTWMRRTYLILLPLTLPVWLSIVIGIYLIVAMGWLIIQFCLWSYSMWRSR